MSTRGTVWYDDDTPMDWQPHPKPWCPSCCVPKCGCPDEPTIGSNITLGSE